MKCAGPTVVAISKTTAAPSALEDLGLPAKGFLSTQISSGGAEGPSEPPPWGGLGSLPVREPVGQTEPS